MTNIEWARSWIATVFAELEGVETEDKNNCLKAALSALANADAALLQEQQK